MSLLILDVEADLVRSLAPPGTNMTRGGEGGEREEREVLHEREKRVVREGETPALSL